MAIRLLKSKYDKKRWEVCMRCLSKHKDSIYKKVEEYYNANYSWQNPVPLMSKWYSTPIEEDGMCRDCQFRFEHTILAQKDYT